MSRSFEDYLARAKSLIAPTFDTKQAQKDALDYLNRAFEVVRNDLMQTYYDYRDANNLEWHQMPDKMRAFTDALPYQLSHWRPKHSAMGIAQNRALFIAKIDTLVIFRDQIKLILVVKPAPKRSAKQIAEDAKKRTCQICGRPIFAETGVIAHHGYQRPGDGYQTQSCIGARELPFESSKDILVPYITAQRDALANMIEARTAVAEEVSPVRLSYEVDHLVDGKRVYSRGHKVTDMIHFTVTSATFAEMKIAHPAYFNSSHVGRYRFADILASDLARRDAKIEVQTGYVNWQQGRAAAWKQIEKWNVEIEKWEAIGE